MLSTWFEVDVTTKEFRHLIEQKDIFDHREMPRKVCLVKEISSRMEVSISKLLILQ